MELITALVGDMVYPGEGIENCSYQGDRELPVAEPLGDERGTQHAGRSK
jgi:hypothetical protein